METHNNNAHALQPITTQQSSLSMPLIRDTQTPPQVHHWQPKQYLLISIMAPVMLFLTLVCAAELISYQEELHEETLRQESLEDKANQIRTVLEYELNSNLHLATALVSYIQSKQGKTLPEEIEPWVSNLQERAHYMRAIAIAPANTVSYLYPLKGNEAALGLHYPNNKEQWPAIQKVIFSKRPGLAGPVHLQQGGMGLIYRMPVFLNNNKDYWGLVSTVLNFDELYELMQSRARYLGIKVAIKDNDNGGKILFGEKDVIANSEMNLNISGRNWQLISSQIAPSNHSLLSTIRVAGWLIALIISILFNSFLRSLAQQSKTRHQLYESKYRFTQAFDSAPQGMALISRNGLLIDLNDSLCSTLGYTYAELHNQNFFSFVAPGQRERLSNIIEGIYPKPGTNHQYESLLLHQSGQTINVIISLAPTQAAAYESDWIVQIIDISHRIAFEHLLQEEASYNQSILNAVIDGIITIDTIGNIRSANPATAHIFDYPLDQFPHQHINQFIQDPESGSIMRHIKYHTAKIDLNTEINHDVIGVKSNGEQFPLELQLACIQRKNEKLFIAVVRDISERKRLEQAKQEFISNISHELRTPLTSILASLSLMKSGALGQFSEQAEKIIHIADQNGQKLGALINDLLDMDKLINGKMNVDFKIQPIYPLVVKAIENLAAMAKRNEITVELLRQDSGWVAKVDSSKLHHILTNLLSNAIKFSPAHTQVTVNILNNINKLRIEIIDQGPGIPREEHDLLFQKFYQVDRSNSRPVGGAGLGLAISRELITLMHGEIGLSSEPGKGSCFFIELPLINDGKHQE
jgi:PAS domain S-box-containing protein